MPLLQRLAFAVDAVAQLGYAQVSQYALYQLALRSGLYRLFTPVRGNRWKKNHLTPTINLRSFPLPAQADLQAVIGGEASILLAEAQDIASDKVRLFGGPVVDLDLVPPTPLKHWTRYAFSGVASDGTDIKYTWEHARFGWACILARAYRLSGDELYAEAFWRHTDQFFTANPPNQGPNWASAQEVAIRLIALVFSYRTFSEASSSTSERRTRLAQAIEDHARRIPPTLIYARSQNNNHLLTEAAALCTAARCLPEHREANSWWKTGWDGVNAGLLSQIFEDGSYIQQSTNYHRLMLQVALWVSAFGVSIPEEIQRRLASATRWLLAITDPGTGHVPNLGHNDGSYILPLAASPQGDFRPVLQAAGMVFLGTRIYPQGPWDEMALWLGIQEKPGRKNHEIEDKRLTPISSTDGRRSPLVLFSSTNRSWAYFRVARYNNRPAHADQLHLDLWWRGYNLAQDAGTYLYNAGAPWDNSLARTAVHNTLTVGGLDQMTRAGRFLWLDWAQGRIVTTESGKDDFPQRAVAEQDGYARLGINHRRTVSIQTDGSWLIEDLLLPFEKRSGGESRRAQDGDRSHRPLDIRLHWLLPDWPWELDEDQSNTRAIISLRSPHGWVQLRTAAIPNPKEMPLLSLVRGGEILSGAGEANRTAGWVSPTYGQKNPALSFTFCLRALVPVTLVSQWALPE